MAGYPKTPLVKKLGLPSSGAAYVRNAPASFFADLGAWPDNLANRKRVTGNIDYIHLFAKKRKELDSSLSKAKPALTKSGTLWISWPKKSSGVATDLSDSIVRELGLAAGLVDVKVCAVDDVWSGLKFVYRLKDR